MASIGKKIISVFMETAPDVSRESPVQGPAASASVPAAGAASAGAAAGALAAAGAVTAARAVTASAAAPDQRFSEYFDKLFSDANIPGPDYYEFARMITAMQAIPDERARYAAAFAGLQVQGLDKEKLLSTAAEYLRVLTTDADHFGKTVEAALQEKVHSRTAEAEEKNKRIQALSQEILDLQTQIGAMQNEIREAKTKLEAGNNAYAAESERRRQQLQSDIDKINQYIH